MRWFVPLGAALLLGDMLTGAHLGGFRVWGWAYFTVIIAVGVSPHVALPFLVACVALVYGSRLGRTAAPGQEEIEPAIDGIWLSSILAVAVLWFLVMLIVHLRTVLREEASAGTTSPDGPEA